MVFWQARLIMRRLFLFALLASAAVPALAAPSPDEQQRRADGHDKSRAARNDNGDHGDSRPAWVRGHGGMSGSSAPDSAPRRRWEGTSETDQTVAGPAVRRGQRNTFPAQGGDGAGSGQPQVQGGFSERLRQYREAHPRTGGSSSTAAGQIPRIPTNNSPVRSTLVGQHSNQWSGSWRNDHRYDWSQYRRQHRSLFHFGIYYDPYGFGYNRMMPGWSMWPNYFQSSYWLDNPWMYRLPPAYGPYRWVRYWDDALLVNTYTGEVVDVVYDFFW